LEVLSKGNSKSGNKNGTVMVKAPNGFCKEVPIWMSEAKSASYCISRNAEISSKAILKLIELLECSIEDLKF
jgi:hypothetical protein